MGNCKACRREIEEAAGRAQLGREAEAHLATCRECREFWRERASLRSLLGGLERVAAPGDFDVRLRARMARGRDGGRGRFLFNLTFTPGFAAVASLVFVCALAAALYAGRGTSENRPVARQSQPQAVTPLATSSASVQAPGAVRSVRVAGGDEVAILRGEGSGEPRARRPSMTRALRVRESAGRTSVRAEAAVASRTFSFGTSRVLESSKATPAGGSGESMRVVLRDEHGSARVVPVRSVSFGSQELIGSGQGSRRTAATSKEGVW